MPRLGEDGGQDLEDRVFDCLHRGTDVGVALFDSWLGVTPSTFNLLGLVVYTVVIGGIAVKVFRWE